MALKKREQYIVIDLGSHSIKIISASYDGNNIKIKDAFIVKTPELAYYDGKINDKNAIVTAIKSALYEKRIKEKKCILTFNSRDVIQKDMNVPNLPYDETIGLIRYEISQYLPINVEEYDIDYKKVSSFIDQDGNEMLTVLSYAVKKQIIDEFHDLILSCGLEPVFLDIHSNSVSKFVSHINNNISTKTLLDSDDKQVLAFIDLGHRTNLIHIFEGEDEALSRNVSIGFYEQDKLLMETFKTTAEEAEKIRKEKIYSEDNDMELLSQTLRDISLYGFDDIDKGEHGLGEGMMSEEEKVLFKVLGECMIINDDMVSEISKILMYYTSRTKNNKIDKVILHGQASSNSSLIDYFSSVFDFDVETLDLENVKGIDFPKDIECKNCFVNVIGALIRRKEG